MQREAALTLNTIQEWEGYVLEARETDSQVRLIDLTTGSSHEEEEAIISLKELSDDDAANMCAGSIFRWVIGYARTAEGTKKCVSRIAFSDLPMITKSDLQDGEVWAGKLIQMFES